MGCGQTYSQPFMFKQSDIFISTAGAGTIQPPTPERRFPPPPLGWLTRAARVGARRG